MNKIIIKFITLRHSQCHCYNAASSS